MKLGTFLMPLHPPEKPRTECFDEDVDFVIYAEELGFTEAWCGHHVTMEWEPIAANDVFMANLIARTTNIKLGIGVSILPQHHPANVAARIALLDHLAHGRVYWGFGQGGVPTDWELFNLPDGKTQAEMTAESLQIILMLWTEDPPYKFDGKFWQIDMQSHNKDLRMGYPLRPYQQPHPPIGMTLMGGSSKGGAIGGQRGYFPISTNLVHQNTVAKHWETYCQGAATAGLPEPSRDIWRVSRSIFVGESNDEAWEFCLNSSFGKSLHYLLTLMRKAEMLKLVKDHPDMPDENATVEYMLKKLCIIGDKKSCTEQLEELWEVTGGFGTLLFVKHDFDDVDQWKNCLQVLAEEIVPKLPGTNVA